MYRILSLILLLPSLVFAELDVKSIDYNSGFLGFNKDKSVPFNILTSHHCMFGDFDAVRQDMMFSGTKKLIATLRSLETDFESSAEILGEISKPKRAESKEEFTAHMVALDRYFKRLGHFGEDFDLELPDNMGGSHVFLLSVCKDSSGTNSCKDKPVKDITEILDQYKQSNKAHIPADHVYYQQILIADQGKFNFFTDSINHDSSEKILAYLTEKGHEVSDHASGLVQQAAILRSFAFEVHNNRIQLDLPVFDPVKCGTSNSPQAQPKDS